MKIQKDIPKYYSLCFLFKIPIATKIIAFNLVRLAQTQISTELFLLSTFLSAIMTQVKSGHLHILKENLFLWEIPGPLSGRKKQEEIKRIIKEKVRLALMIVYGMNVYGLSRQTEMEKNGSQSYQCRKMHSTSICTIWSRGWTMESSFWKQEVVPLHPLLTFRPPLCDREKNLTFRLN